MKCESVFLFYFFTLTTCSCAFAYQVPPAIVQPLSPVGLRVSIPDEEGISLFAFHGNVNVEFESGLEAGQMSQDVLRQKNGRWTYTNREVSLKLGDVVYYWLRVERYGLGYNRVFQNYTVTEFFSETGQPDSSPVPPDTRKPVLVPPPDVQKIPEECKRSATTVNSIEQCSGHLVFDTQFSNNIGQNWTQNVHFNEDDSQFVVFLNDHTYSDVMSGLLTVTPTLLDTEYSKGFALQGRLDLTARCTTTDDHCIREAKGPNILPPVISARLTTERTFSFRYGIVEMKVKLPLGDWVVPEIWLLPKVLRYGKVNSGKIILGNSFGNRLLTVQDGNDFGNNNFTAGLEVGEQRKVFEKVTTSGLWSDDFHIYKLIWRENEIKFYLDNEELGSWNGSELLLPARKGTLSPFDQEFYINLGIHVGGDRDFPDGCLSSGRPKPWRNAQAQRKLAFYNDTENWHSTWNDKTKLQVQYVKVWAL